MFWGECQLTLSICQSMLSEIGLRCADFLSRERRAGYQQLIESDRLCFRGNSIKGATLELILQLKKPFYKRAN